MLVVERPVHVYTAGGGQEYTLRVQIRPVVVLNLRCDIDKS